MSYQDLARTIVDLIGTSNNVKSVTACQTRLRFSLNDHSKVMVDELRKINGVLGVNVTDTQYQIIIGTHVDKVLTEVEKIIAEESLDEGSVQTGQGEPVKVEKNDPFAAKSGDNIFIRGIKFLFEYLSTAFSPILISILGSGVIKGLDILFSGTLGLYVADSGVGRLMTLMGDIPFYFLPFLIAYGAARKLDTNIPLAISLAGAYMHPSISNAAANGEVWTVFGMDVPLLGYNGTVLPILFSVLLLSYVYKKADEVIPASVRVLFVPIIVLLLIVPVQLLILGPLGFYLSGYVATGLESLFSLNSWVGGFVYGALRQVLVMTGLHLSLTPIILENIRVFGGDYLMPVHAMSAMAVAGTALGISVKAKDTNIKTAAMATFLPGFIGVTEPGIFGLAIRFVKPWIPIAIGGGLSASFVSGMGAESVAISLPGPLSFAIFADTLPIMIIGWVIAFVSSFVIAYIIGVDESL